MSNDKFSITIVVQFKATPWAGNYELDTVADRVVL